MLNPSYGVCAGDVTASQLALESSTSHSQAGATSSVATTTIDSDTEVAMEATCVTDSVTQATS